MDGFRCHIPEQWVRNILVALGENGVTGAMAHRSSSDWLKKLLGCRRRRVQIVHPLVKTDHYKYKATIALKVAERCLVWECCWDTEPAHPRLKGWSARWSQGATHVLGPVWPRLPDEHRRNRVMVCRYVHSDRHARANEASTRWVGKLNSTRTHLLPTALRRVTFAKTGWLI